jgi:hypothetical protein
VLPAPDAFAVPVGLRTLMRWHELHVQARTIVFARLSLGRDQEPGFETPTLHSPDLEGDRDVRSSILGALIIVAMFIGLQLVGLNAKPMSLLTRLRNGFPHAEAGIETNRTKNAQARQAPEDRGRHRN